MPYPPQGPPADSARTLISSRGGTGLGSTRRGSKAAQVGCSTTRFETQPAVATARSASTMLEIDPRARSLATGDVALSLALTQLTVRDAGAPGHTC